MFRITANTCREFTFAEILIMAAMNNVEARRQRTTGRVQMNTTAEQKR